MRQILLMLTIAIGSPLAMAQDPGASTTALAADAAQPPAAAAQDQRAQPTHLPTSAIGRALSQLLREGNRQPAAPTRPDTAGTAAIDAGAAADLAVDRSRLAAQDEQAVP